MENVAEFLENIDNNLTYYEIPTQLACAYLKGHLTGRALDWFDVLGYRVVEDKEFRDANQSASNRFPIRNRQENWREIGVNNQYSDNSSPQREFYRFESQGVGDNRRLDSRRRSGQSDHRFRNQGGRQSGSRNGAFRGQNGQNRISSLRMTPVDLPYIPILLNETFITALRDMLAEKSFISEEIYRRFFSYRPRQKTKDRVVTAQEAPCCHIGRVESQIRIRDFQKTWEFHILNNMQYQCILGIDYMKESKLTLDFDKKSLVFPDDQIKQLPKVEKPVKIDLSDTKLREGQKQKLKDLFNTFQGLFSDKPGLTYVLYHEIDTGDQGPVVSRPYRYDRVKQKIINYHIEKMLQEGKIRPIQSPYASPVILTRKNNGLPPDSPEAYRFAIDYRKLNAITKYPRYPLPVIDDLITNIPHITIMSTLDLKSGYFQLAISSKDIEKNASRLKEPEGIPEEHWDRQSTAEQPQEKEPQHGSLRRRSGG
ncbi:retrovirus-related Pol polyprotein from transposon gypsy [Trichonephila clavipes]|nr:retrovirus-related Pol polyprotein from transposon gypsy [Trichonephila clavipes]